MAEIFVEKKEIIIYNNRKRKRIKVGRQTYLIPFRNNNRLEVFYSAHGLCFYALITTL